MTSLIEIHAALEKLSQTDMAAFRSWFAEFDAVKWDRQLESDIEAGYFDSVVKEAIQDFRAGRCTEL